MHTSWLSRDSLALLAFSLFYFALLVLSTQLSLLPVSTVVFMHLMPIPLAVLGYWHWRGARARGLVCYLPTQMQEMLMQKSLIDVLMTIWTLPSPLEYLKRFIYPFLVPVTREEAVVLFSDLNPSFAAKLETKGLVTLLPEGMQRLIEGQQAWSARFLAPMRVGLGQLGERKGREEGSTASNSPKIRSLHVQTSFTAPLRTQLICSSVDSTPLLKSSDTLNTAIARLRHKVPTLEPIFGHILGFQLRQVMSLLSTKGLTVGAVIALGGLLVQFVCSRRVRRWTGSAMKLGAFGGCMCVLATCLLSLVVKSIHTRVQDTGKSEPKGIEKLMRLPEELSSEFVSRFEKQKPIRIHKAFS